jgi:hypothetical protein
VPREAYAGAGDEFGKTGKRSLLDDYQYAMYGKIFKYSQDKSNLSKVCAFSLSLSPAPIAGAPSSPLACALAYRTSAGPSMSRSAG